MDQDILKYVATKHDLEELREEFRHSQSEVVSRLDKIIGTVERLDQERLFTFEHVKRPEGKVEKNLADIDHIKDVLKIN